MKLKLNPGAAPSQPGPSAPATPSGGLKLKIKSSATPAESTEKPPKRKYTKKIKEAGPSSGVKRPADGKLPAAKRTATDPNRRISFTLKDESKSASGKLKLAQRKPSKSLNIVTTRRPYPRPKGVGYDSEASDAEADPSIEQQFVLRMAPGEDCTYLRDAIENKTIGLKPEDGGADVSFKFLEHTLRRAVVTVRGHKYAAVLVDLPCIVEGLKSWDRRGWWKVADICQMLLVLGPCTDDASALAYQLPREVDKTTLAYAHGLTPPMHWVKKRRFRKRISYREIENVEEELDKLLKDDELTANAGGSVTWKVYDAEMPRQQDFDDYVETTENQYGEADDGLFDDDGLAAELEAGLAEDEDAEGEEDAPTPATINVVETPLSSTPAPDLSAETPAAQSSDEDDDDDDDDADDADSPDGMDVVDEAALEKQKELAQQLEEVEDLKREVASKRLEFERTPNQLLKQRIRQNLRALEEELAMKRKAFGMDDVDDD